MKNKEIDKKGEIDYKLTILIASNIGILLGFGFQFGFLFQLLSYKGLFFMNFEFSAIVAIIVSILTLIALIGGTILSLALFSLIFILGLIVFGIPWFILVIILGIFAGGISFEKYKEEIKKYYEKGKNSVITRGIIFFVLFVFTSLGVLHYNSQLEEGVLVEYIQSGESQTGSLVYYNVGHYFIEQGEEIFIIPAQEIEKLVLKKSIQ